jgi:NADPH:quinone reductase-like Zn-dependent oxidoreductase
VRAIVQDRYGSARVLRLEEIPPPEIGPTELLVQVAAAGVDRGALHLMRGLPYVVRLAGHGLRAPKSPIPGTNFAGEVVDVGDDVTRFRMGDMVYGTALGTFTEFVAAEQDRVAMMPASVSFEEAAVLPYAGSAAVEAIVERAPAIRGLSVAVVGASGAVGTIAIQVAREMGAGAVTAVSGPQSTEIVRMLGADTVIDYTEADFTAHGADHDVILDIGGNTPLPRLRRALAPGGTLIIIGGEKGGKVFGGIHRQLAAQVISPFIREKLGTFIASGHADVLEVITDFVDGRGVRPVMGRCYPLALAPEAIRELEGGSSRGRIAIVP